MRADRLRDPAPGHARDFVERIGRIPPEFVEKTISFGRPGNS
jgi:hypothetical protein